MRGGLSVSAHAFEHPPFWQRIDARDHGGLQRSHFGYVDRRISFSFHFSHGQLTLWNWSHTSFWTTWKCRRMFANRWLSCANTFTSVLPNCRTGNDVCHRRSWQSFGNFWMLAGIFSETFDYLTFPGKLMQECHRLGTEITHRVVRLIAILMRTSNIDIISYIFMLKHRA